MGSSVPVFAMKELLDWDQSLMGDGVPNSEWADYWISFTVVGENPPGARSHRKTPVFTHFLYISFFHLAFLDVYPENQSIYCNGQQHHAVNSFPSRNLFFFLFFFYATLLPVLSSYVHSRWWWFYRSRSPGHCIIVGSYCSWMGHIICEKIRWHCILTRKLSASAKHCISNLHKAVTLRDATNTLNKKTKWQYYH